MRTDLLQRKEEILQWISEGKSKAFIAKELGCNPKTINPLFERLEIIYDGNQSGKGQHKSNGRNMNLQEYLDYSADIQSNKVRKKLLDEHYKEHKCECCGLSEWLG